MQEIGQIAMSTARRLETRKEAADESLDQIIRRLLDETIEEVSLESVLERLVDHYDQVVGISVHMGSSDPVGLIIIKVCAADALSSGDEGVLDGPAPPYNTSKTRLVIEDAETDTRHVVPFEVVEATYPPGGEQIAGTAIAYRPDGYVNAEPVSLSEGIKRVRAELGTVVGESEDEPQEQRPDEQSDPE